MCDSKMCADPEGTTRDTPQISYSEAQPMVSAMPREEFPIVTGLTSDAIYLHSVCSTRGLRPH